VGDENNREGTICRVGVRGCEQSAHIRAGLLNWQCFIEQDRAILMLEGQSRPTPGGATLDCFRASVYPIRRMHLRRSRIIQEFIEECRLKTMPNDA
jgi:hypothetical protein